MGYFVRGYGEDDGEYNSKEDYEAQMYRKKLAKRQKKTTKQPGFYMPQSAVNPYTVMNEEGDVTIPESSIQGCGPGCNTITKSGSFIHGSGSCCTGQ